MCKGIENKLCSNILESHFMSLLCFDVLCFFVFMFVFVLCSSHLLHMFIVAFCVLVFFVSLSCFHVWF